MNLTLSWFLYELAFATLKWPKLLVALFLYSTRRVLVLSTLL